MLLLNWEDNFINEQLISLLDMVPMGIFLIINIMVYILWFPKTRSCNSLEAVHDLALSSYEGVVTGLYDLLYIVTAQLHLNMSWK